MTNNSIMKKIFLSLFFLMILQVTFSQKNKKETEVEVEVEEIETVKKNPILTSTFILNAGVFVPTKTMKLSVDGNTPNNIIDFNKAFNLNNRQTTLELNFIWRFTKNKKWHLGAEYFSIKSSGKKSLDNDIEWNDITYPVGADVEAGFGLDIYRIFVGRVITSGLRYEFGGGLGIHAMEFNTFIQGQARAGDLSTSFQRESINVLIPVPNLGFWVYYTPSSKWVLTARMDWFAVGINEYNGVLWNVSTGVKYQIIKNFGVAVNYKYFKVDVKANNTYWKGSVDMIFSGPSFGVFGNF